MGMPEAKFLKDHDLPALAASGVRYEKRAAKTPDGQEVPGLYNAWIVLDNPAQVSELIATQPHAIIISRESNIRELDSVPVKLLAKERDLFETATTVLVSGK